MKNFRKDGKHFGRRLFLKASGAVAFLLGTPSWVGAFFLEEEFPVRTVERENFSFDAKTGSVRSTNKKIEGPYQLLVDGLVKKPAKLSYQDLRALPQISQVSDLHCVEGWSVSDVKWGGLRFKEILNKVQPTSGAQYAIFHSLGETNSRPQGQGHYIESMSLKDLLDGQKQCLLALDLDGKPLSHEHGSPVRLVAPYSLGYKNIKYVTRIEFSEKPRPGWWTLANPIYPVDAPVPQNRLRKR
ncbi:MAG: molybdopterin-dependent oxidoreductase [Dissulfurispiraceae bacterium]